MELNTRISCLLGALPALLLAAVVAGPASAAVTAPQVQLPAEGVGGQQAIDMLGPQFEAVAAWHRRSPDAFRRMLLSDPHMRLDSVGRLYAIDHLDRALAAPPVMAATTAIAYAPLDRTFELHSRPTAKRTIYLDFTGATLSDTAWNSSGGTITALPYDTDGDSGSFSDTEKQVIQNIYQRVAEDFAPFDIDVTTEEPPFGRLNRRDDADLVYGTTVLITNHSGVYECSCGGVAFVGVFDSVGDYYKPALVFYDMLGSGYEKYVAEAISHEAGHNLGLLHDGYSGGGYYPGHSTGVANPSGWAPIMGVGYYQPLVQWSQGEYATANNTEDDFAVAVSNGAPLRTDDHGDSRGTATALTVTTVGGLRRLSGAGVIGTRTDTDYFKFVGGAGPTTITVTASALEPNLDVAFRLLRSDGTEVARVSPQGTLSATMRVTLPSAGTYYIVVDGVGWDDPATKGYSDYGSLGAYKISGNVPLP